MPTSDVSSYEGSVSSIIDSQPQLRCNALIVSSMAAIYVGDSFIRANVISCVVSLCEDSFFFSLVQQNIGVWLFFV